MTRAAFVRGLLRAAVVVAVLLSAFTVRVVVSAMSELALGRKLEQDGDVEAAIVHYRRSARWYAPLSPYHVQALAALGRIAVDAEKSGDVELALSAHRAVRASILSTRSFYVPSPARLDVANKRIAALMAGLPAPPIDAGKSVEQLEREHLELLEHNPDPHLGWTFLLLLGFCAWVAGAFIFTLRAIDEQDRFVRPEALRWGALIAAGLVMFVLGMAMA